MDLHAGDMVEDLEPFLGYLQTGNADVDGHSREMIDAYVGARWVTHVLPGGERAGMLYGAAAQNGVPAILAESGGRGLPIEQDVQRHVDGVLNIWRTLGLVNDTPPEPRQAPRTIARNEWLRSEHEGIFLCRVKPGDQVAQDETLGEMVDLLGNQLKTIRAPAGRVLLRPQKNSYALTSAISNQAGLK